MVFFKRNTTHAPKLRELFTTIEFVDSRSNERMNQNIFKETILRLFYLTSCREQRQVSMTTSELYPSRFSPMARHTCGVIAYVEEVRDAVIPVTSKLALQWLPCQAPGVIGSAQGLVGPVSVYCDWVR